VEEIAQAVIELVFRAAQNRIKQKKSTAQESVFTRSQVFLITDS
jgi:hypothetical protein